MSNDPDTIQLAHGGGGRLAHELIENEILPRFGGGALAGLPDAARLPGSPGLVFSTDSYVVQPLEFSGGNIGHLAVHGTANDIAVAGGRPLWLALALIIEEGLPLAVLRRVLDAARAAAEDCGIQVVTGDTKVVPHGQADSLFINTAGIGEPLPGLDLDPRRIQPGDAVLVSGTLGDHGMAVMAARHQLALRAGPESDTAPVQRLIAGISEFWPAIRFMRDPTRGGLAAVLNEMADGRSIGFALQEAALPFHPHTRAAAELLGLDLLQSACEGRVVLVCDPQAGAGILARWRADPAGAGAARIGAATGAAGRVTLDTLAGGSRLVAWPRGELLPRIC